MDDSIIKKFSKILFINAIIFLIISFPLYSPIILISSGINQSLKYIKSHKDLKKVPDFFVLEKLAILAARLNYHNVPYRKIITTDKDCFSQNKDLIYKPTPFSKCIQSNLEFKNEINFGKYGNRTDEYFKSDKKINLIVIGDSHAMGWGVSNNEVFSAFLNKSDINTLNLSVPSYGTYRQLEYLKNWALKYPNKFKETKNIVIQYCGNDLKENIYAINGNNIIPNTQIEQYKIALELDDNPYHLSYGESYLSILKDFNLLRSRKSLKK